MRFSLILILLFSKNAKCQSDTTRIKKFRNAVTCEVIGHSRSLFSANYERLIKPYNSTINYSARLGIGYTPGSHEDSARPINPAVTIPFVISILAGKKNHFAQLGIGYTAAFGKNSIDSGYSPPVINQKFESAYILSLGYRYMRDGFVGQIYPLLQWTNNPTSRFSVGGGISIGVTF